MAKRVHLSFTRPEDLRLVAWMEKRAYECRYDLATFIVVGLHEAFGHQLPDEPEPRLEVPEAVENLFPSPVNAWRLSRQSVRHKLCLPAPAASHA